MEEIKRKISKLVEKWRGEGKINILDIQENKEEGWRVRFEENNGEQTYVDLETFEEADEFSHTFGGKNNYTIALIHITI